jgi:hypothetical protein
MAEGHYICIGINEPAIANNGQINPLRFAEISAKKVKSFLDKIGFKKSSALLGEKATKQKTLNRFKSLAKKVKKDDLLVVFYCGHGRQLGASGGFSEPANAADKLDETWILHDTDLIDDEITKILTDFTTNPRILVISDSCYSAGLLPKILHIDPANGPHLPVFNKILVPEIRPNLMFAQPIQTATRVLKKAEMPKNWHVIFLAASGEKEEAREFTRFAGIPATYFTNSMLEAMKMEAAMENYQTFFDQIKANLYQITGTFTPEYKLFGLQKTDAFPTQKPFTI